MIFEKLKKTEPKRDLSVVNLVEGIESSIIKDIAFDMFKLAKGLKEKALSYDTIISDDASGRLVSLFLKKVFDGLRKRQNQPSVEIKFIASGRFLSESKLKAIEDFFTENKENLGKVLLVTEYIETGKSIKKVVRILNSLGIDFDLASLTISGRERIQQTKDHGLKGNFFFGNESYESGGLKLHNKTDLSGVTKDLKSGDPFPERFKQEDMGTAQQLRVQRSINQARKDIDNLAKNTLKLLK